MSVLNQSGDDAVECPLCMEPLEVDDLNFFPCTCGYQICRFCWHRIRTDENGLCPACRKAYSENPADFKPLTKEEIVRLKAEKRLKDQQRKQRVTENRKHLANVRVVQKNLVFIVGLPMRLSDASILRKHEYFGKFGKIHKLVLNPSTSYAGSQGPSASAYVTYQRSEDALRAIEAVNNIVVDGRTIKTSLGTTKYCSNFMRNQPCPKPECMYLHEMGDQEASFTKEEMHQGKHQEYERKLVQSLHANTSSQRKPTPSPPVTGSIVRDNGTNSQAKEAWPSLQPGQTTNASTNCKETSPPTQGSGVSPPLTNNVAGENGTNCSTTAPQKPNNNNKGENGVCPRRGKSNIESKAQAARNKHKNSQNKEKHGGTRTTSRSESSSNIAQSNSGATVPQANGEVHGFATEPTTDSETVSKPNGGRLKVEQQQQQTSPSTKGLKYIRQSHDSESNGSSGNGERPLQNGEHSNSESESEPQREGSTPASTISSLDDSINTNHQAERLGDSCEEIGSAAILGSSPASTNSSQGVVRQPPPGLHSVNSVNGAQTQQVNHRSIFQADNNSFFSSNSFQKISTTSAAIPQTSHAANSNPDWTNTSLAPIPDSLPTVYSSEDWQAAFGFRTESALAVNQQKSSPSPPPGISFDNEDFVEEEAFNNSQYGCQITETAATLASSLHVDSPATKFMADFEQNSLQRRLHIQSQQENCEYLKQNGHATDWSINVQKTQEQGSDAMKADDDLGFDPFHETQKALAELMENEMQYQQRVHFQQQQQQQREREEQNRAQQQHGSVNLGQHHFSQVAHLAQLQQQQAHLQNLQVLQQSHPVMSRLPVNVIQHNNGAQSPVQNTPLVLGQRSRLPPPGFPSSTPNHMNSFGLGIPRPAPNSNPLSVLSTGSKILPFVSHSSGVLFTGGPQPQPTTFLPQGVGKCAGDTIYSVKEWCDITNQQQQQHQQQQHQHQHQQQQFHHQTIHQKGGWNNFGPIADWKSFDPAIVSSIRTIPFQSTTSTWPFPHAHPSQNVSHIAHQEQNAPATQHWAMQPPPGFTAAAPSVSMNGQPTNTVQAHTKFISAGSEIERRQIGTAEWVQP